MIIKWTKTPMSDFVFNWLVTSAFAFCGIGFIALAIIALMLLPMWALSVAVVIGFSLILGYVITKFKSN